MRARSIKPGICTNELLGRADPYATLLFERLWMLADREGRLEDRPDRIKVQAFPYKPELDVEQLLSWLDANGFIKRYAAGRQRYIQIVEFAKHQHPHHMEAPSVLPPARGTANRYNHAPITKAQRERILRRDKGICVLCGSAEDLHIDHIVPVSRGGSSDDSNLRVLCGKCNTSKGSRPPDKGSSSNGARVEHESISSRARPEHVRANPSSSLTPSSLTPSSLTPDSGLLTPDSEDPKHTASVTRGGGSEPQRPASDPRSNENGEGAKRRGKPRSIQEAARRLTRALTPEQTAEIERKKREQVAEVERRLGRPLP